jgi:hypothetical protein
VPFDSFFEFPFSDPVYMESNDWLPGFTLIYVFFFPILTDLFCPPCLFPGSSELKRGRKKADFNQLL